MMYNIIALIGEAGSGKDRTMQEILKTNSTLHEIISYTTRPMRQGEVEGVNYYYYTDKEFENKISNNEMLESTIFNNQYYGTSYDSLKLDKPNIGVFNPAGIYSMSKFSNIELTVFRITCSDKTRLLRQLNRETNPDVDEIIRRYGTDKKDFSNLKFNYIEIRNENEEDLELAVKTILSEIKTHIDLGQN